MFNMPTTVFLSVGHSPSPFVVRLVGCIQSSKGTGGWPGGDAIGFAGVRRGDVNDRGRPLQKSPGLGGGWAGLRAVRGALPVAQVGPVFLAFEADKSPYFVDNGVQSHAE